MGNDEHLLGLLEVYSQQHIPRKHESNVPWCICSYCVDDNRMKDYERKCCKEKTCITRSERCQFMITDNDNIHTAANALFDVTARRANHDNRTFRHIAFR